MASALYSNIHSVKRQFFSWSPTREHLSARFVSCPPFTAPSFAKERFGGKKLDASCRTKTWASAACPAPSSLLTLSARAEPAKIWVKKSCEGCDGQCRQGGSVLGGQLMDSKRSQVRARRAGGALRVAPCRLSLLWVEQRPCCSLRFASNLAFSS